MFPQVLAAGESPLPAQVVARWLAALPAVRRARLEAWPDPRERDRSLLATRLLREGLRRAGFEGDPLGRLEWTADGRPHLPLPVHFSFSHCDGLVICAVSTAGPVGIDAEPVGQVVASDVALYLNEAERDWAGADPARFLALWTRKEATVKAAGARGLRELREVAIDGDRATFRGRTWFTAPVDAGPAHVSHLSAAEPLPPLFPARLELTTLM